MGNQPPKTASPSANSKTKSNPISRSFFPCQRHRGFIAQRITTGAKIRSPVASPSHHVVHTGPYLAQSAKPTSARLVTPMLGLIKVLATAANANLKTSCERSKTRVPLAKRLTSHAPQSASSVFPAAMATEVPKLPAVVALTRKAPRKMAGHVRYPSTSNAPSAIPAGGHTGDALACKNASLSPSFPARK